MTVVRVARVARMLRMVRVARAIRVVSWVRVPWVAWQHLGDTLMSPTSRANTSTLPSTASLAFLDSSEGSTCRVSHQILSY